MEGQMFKVIINGTTDEDRFQVKHYKVIGPQRGCWVSVVCTKRILKRIVGDEAITEYEQDYWNDPTSRLRSSDGTINPTWIEKGRIRKQKTRHTVTGSEQVIQLIGHNTYLLKQWDE